VSCPFDQEKKKEKSLILIEIHLAIKKTFHAIKNGFIYENGIGKIDFPTT
jgi:hypothetical protein